MRHGKSWRSLNRTLPQRSGSLRRRHTSTQNASNNHHIAGGDCQGQESNVAIVVRRPWLAIPAHRLAIASFWGIFVDMDTKSGESFNLDKAWPFDPDPCTTIRKYLQQACGKRDRAGHTHAFRGVSCCFRNLLPSIDRGEGSGAVRVETETRLLEEFILRAWNDLTPQEKQRFLLSEARWGSKRNTAALVVARHRLVPTRCVDWSYCPLCALFFACNDDSQSDGEVWWFNRNEFDLCVAAQWPALFGKHGHVEAEIEEDFIAGRESQWLVALNYMLLPDDRLDRQKGWITVAGRLGTCHAEKIHRLGVREKGRLVIRPELKLEAIRELEQLGITSESLGLNRGDAADQIATQIREKFESGFPIKNCTAPWKEDART